MAIKQKSEDLTYVIDSFKNHLSMAGNLALYSNVDDELAVIFVEEDAFLGLLGLEESRRGTKNHFDSDKVIHSDDLDLCSYAFLSQQQLERIELNLRILKEDGLVVVVPTELQKIHFSSADKTIAFKAIMHDTKSLLTANVLNAATKYNFSSLLTNSSDFLYFKDLHHAFTASSQTMANITGYSSGDEHVGLTDYDIFPKEHADIYYRLESHILEGKRDNTQQVEPYNDENGNERWVDTRKYPVKDETGKIIGLCGISRDVTERTQIEKALKVSEAHFKQIFNEAPLGIALIDSLTGQIYSVNSMFAKIAGRTMEEMIHVDWMSITHPDDVQKDLDSMALLNAGQTSGFQMEKRYLRKDDTIVWINMTIAPVYVEDKAHPRHLCMIENITERKHTEAQIEAEFQHVASMNAQLTEMNNQLKQAQNQLLQSEKMAAIGLLAAGVAHEINNPIGYVNSNIGTLEKYLADTFTLIDKLESLVENNISDHLLVEELHQFKNKMDFNYIREDVKELLAESHQGLDRVKKIVLDLKEFSHVDTEVHWVSADVHQGLESTLNVIWNELKYKCVLVKEFGILPKITCVPSQLNQVFMNLLINAAQAIEVHGTITLRTGREGDRVWIEVRDTGTGIPPKIIPHLFDPFFTTKEVGKGTGLGLSVSYGIVVDKHHGNIDVHSEVGKGSTFRVWLPVHQPEDNMVLA